jgi:hypothetical protein
MHRRMAGFLAAAGASGFLPAAVVLVDGGPGPPFRFLLGKAALLVAFSFVISLALLLGGVFRFVAAGHRIPPWLFG